MRIAIISKASKLGGGGSIVASKLASLLRENGHFCHHFRRDKEYGYGENESSVFGKFEDRIKWLNHRTRKLGLQELIPWEYFHLKAEIKRLKIDLVHIHDTTTAISSITIRMLAKMVPVVWTMHDYSPFTGGCVYPLQCTRYKDKCGNCPQMDHWPLRAKFDFTKANLSLKRWIHKKGIHFVSPSQFLKKEAVFAGLESSNISVIPNSVNTLIYTPLDKSTCRHELLLEPNKFTILLLAFSIDSPLKGVDDAILILERLQGDFQVLIVGKVSESQRTRFANIHGVFTGYIDQPEALNKCYNAADIFINCSKADNLPLVVLESLAAGTPVYGYATGGIPEMITNGETGELVETGSKNELLEKVSMALRSGLSLQPENCRLAGMNLYSDSVFLDRTLSLYSKQISQWRKRDKK